MKKYTGYTSKPLSFNRKAVIASASVTREKSPIHCLSEIDITEPRRLIKDYFERTGEKLSLTAYIVTCLARVVSEHPELNSFTKGNRLYTLDDVTVSVLVEREITGERVPEPMSIQQAQLKSYKQVNDEIRTAKKLQSEKLGSLSDATWIRLIPGFLLKTFIRIADKNIHMSKRYGKMAVTAVGMFSKDPVWFIPPGTATILVTVGSISNKVIEWNGQIVSREHLCITVSFDHFIIDGAPASRFMNEFTEAIKNGRFINL
jgi:pyruvate/2-oxoglutarate dehydrogenase complex dihydrolipoamide acyltransferase (E2) component